MRSHGLIFTAVLLVFFLNPARADINNDFGAYLGAHGYTSMPVDLRGSNNEIVQAVINGKRIYMLVDTGFRLTSLSADCAHDLRLDVHDTKMQSFGVGGVVEGKEGVAAVASFKLKDYEINRLSEIVVLSRKANVEGVDGYLGFDYLHFNAAIMPVGASILIFKPGNQPPATIDTYMGQMGFKAIPLHYGPGGLRAEGRMNEVPFTVIVDSGAAYSTFDSDLVNQAKISCYALPLRFRGLDGRDQSALAFTVKDLEVGPLKMDSLESTSGKAPIFAKFHCQGLLGFDILAAHKAIIDLGHDILWMQ